MEEESNQDMSSAEDLDLEKETMFSKHGHLLDSGQGGLGLLPVLNLARSTTAVLELHKNVDKSQIRRNAVIERYRTLSNIALDSANLSDEEFDSDSELDGESGSESDYDDSELPAVGQLKNIPVSDEEDNEYLEKFSAVMEERQAEKLRNSCNQKVADNSSQSHTTTAESADITTSINLAQVSKSIADNNELLHVLINVEAKVKQDLTNIQSEYQKITKSLSDSLSRQGLFRGSSREAIHRYGMPYIKDAQFFPAPYNEDYYIKKARGELVVQNNEHTHRRYWTAAHRAKLLESIRQSEIEGLIAGINRERKLLELKIRDCDDPTEAMCLEDELSMHTITLTKVHDLKLKNIMGTRREPHDWLKISATDFDGRWSPDDCKNMWEIYLSPNVNKTDWTEEENARLLDLVEKHNAEDWDTIAAELGTGRTAFICCTHYQCDLNSRLHNVRFSADEDNQLAYQIETTRMGNSVSWSKIEFLVSGRNRNQLSSRWKRIRPEAVHGRFTDEEDLMILSSARKHNMDFSKVAKDVPGRDRAQVYGRFLILSRNWNRGSWTREEDKLLVSLVERYGKSFYLFAKFFKDRNKSQIRHRYNSIQRHMENQSLNETPDGLLGDELPFVPTRSGEKRVMAIEKRTKKFVNRLSKIPLQTALKRLEKRKNKMNKRSKIKLEFDPGFLEYFQVGYAQRPGRKRMTPYTSEELRTQADTFRLLCTLFSANLNIPEDDEVLDEHCLHFLTQQILVHVRDTPLTQSIPLDTQSCSDTPIIDVPPVEEIPVSTSHIDLPFNANAAAASTCTLSMFSDPLDFSYSYLNFNYPPKPHPVNVPAKQKTVAPAKRVNSQKNKSAVNFSDLPTETIVTFTTQPNSTELVLDDGQSGSLNSPAATRQVRVIRVLPRSTPAASNGVKTPNKLLTNTAWGVHATIARPMSTADERTVEVRNKTNKYVKKKDRPPPQVDRTSECVAKATSKKRKLDEIPTTQTAAIRRPRKREDFPRGKVRVIQDCNTREYKAVTLLNYKAIPVGNAKNVKLQLDPIPLTGIYSNRTMHHDTLPLHVGLPPGKRKSNVMPLAYDMQRALPAMKVPPCVATLVGYRTMLLSHKRLKAMVPKRWKAKDVEEAEAPSEACMKAKQLWKERCQMLFACPRFMATITPFFDSEEYFQSRQNVFLDPGDEAMDSLEERRKAHKLFQRRRSNATQAQYKCKRRTQPIPNVNNNDDETTDDSSDDDDPDDPVEKYYSSSESSDVETDSDVDEDDVVLKPKPVKLKTRSTMISRLAGTRKRTHCKNNFGEKDICSNGSTSAAPVSPDRRSRKRRRHASSEDDDSIATSTDTENSISPSPSKSSPYRSSQYRSSTSSSSPSWSSPSSSPSKSSPSKSSPSKPSPSKSSLSRSSPCKSPSKSSPSKMSPSASSLKVGLRNQDTKIRRSGRVRKVKLR